MLCQQCGKQTPEAGRCPHCGHQDHKTLSSFARKTARPRSENSFGKELLRETGLFAKRIMLIYLVMGGLMLLLLVLAFVVH